MLPLSLSSQKFYQRTFLIGAQLPYNVMLVSAVQTSESAICKHISLPSWTSFPLHPPSHPSRSPKSTELSPLCFIAGSHWLSILPMVMYICQFQSPSASHPPYSHRVYICSLYLHHYFLFLDSSEI